MDSPGVTLVEEKVEDGRFYLHVTAPSAVPPGSMDDLEFTLNPAERLVFYRSATREAVFVNQVAPTQPLTDNGANRKRLEGIRAQLGWGKLTYGDEFAAY